MLLVFLCGFFGLITYYLCWMNRFVRYYVVYYLVSAFYICPGYLYFFHDSKNILLTWSSLFEPRSEHLIIGSFQISRLNRLVDVFCFGALFTLYSKGSSNASPPSFDLEISSAYKLIMLSIIS